MALYTATLSAQNTSVYVCNITRRNTANEWYANACVTGSLGGGTVTFQISFDGGVTKYALNQDGTASTAAISTVNTSLNLKTGNTGYNNVTASLYASIGTATAPTALISVVDNR